MNSRRAAALASIALLLVSLGFAVLLVEVGLRLALNSGDFLQATLVDDTVLGHRIEPFSTGHDGLGFRNEEAPTHSPLVAVGDSMTYGVSASRDRSWPKQLGKLLGEPVYNMGLGGYGPLQYLHLARASASAMKPRLVIIGFYFGNDLMDSFHVSRDRPHWHDWRVSAGSQSAPATIGPVEDAQPRKRFAALRDWLARKSMLYSVLKATVLKGFAVKEQEGLALRADPDTWLLWKDPADPAVQTIFTLKGRLTALDLGVDSVRDGMQISQRAFAEIKIEAERQGFGVLVVLIPTKERAYCRYLLASGEKLTETFSRLCEAESKANAHLTSFLHLQGIQHLDGLPALEDRIARHIAVYPAGADGHPQANGYAAIAEAIATVVRTSFPKR